MEKPTQDEIYKTWEQITTINSFLIISVFMISMNIYDIAIAEEKINLYSIDSLVFFITTTICLIAFKAKLENKKLEQEKALHE